MSVGITRLSIDELFELEALLTRHIYELTHEYEDIVESAKQKKIGDEINKLSAASEVILSQLSDLCFATKEY